MPAHTFSWWIWILLGLLLLAGELLTPGGFYLLFFGAGALVVGLLSLFGLGMPLALEGLVFVGLSVAAMLFFRKPLLEWFRRRTPASAVDPIVGEVAVTLEQIAARGHGKAELRGTSWNAENLTDFPIPGSQRCRVERVDGLTLYIRPL